MTVATPTRKARRGFNAHLRLEEICSLYEKQFDEKLER